MRMTRRGRSRLPRGYYLVKTAKHGGFEAGNKETMPVVSTMGQIEISEEARSELEKARAMQTGAMVTGTAIRLGLLALFIYAAVKVVRSD